MDLEIKPSGNFLTAIKFLDTSHVALALPFHEALRVSSHAAKVGDLKGAIGIAKTKVR